MPPRLVLLPALALASVSLLAQTATPTTLPSRAAVATVPTFTRADVHLGPWINYPYMNGGNLHGDRYTLRQATMLDLIANAYSLDPTMIQGGPSWLEFDRFNIVAQAPPGTSPATLRLMLRSLLIDRFGLVAHNGTTPLPAWVLTAVKPKLTAAESGTTECGPTKPTVVSTLAVACHNMPMDQFAPILQGFGGGYFGNKPVVDSTGLGGRYDFDFQWTPYSLLAQAGSDGISIFAAMEKQLGLRLDLGTAPRSVLIVDKVNRTPTPNAPGIEKALPPEPPAQFEVAVIKPSRPDETSGGMMGPDRVDLQGDSLKYLIQFAWNLNLDDDEFLVGLPKWGASDRYDIQAKASAEDLAQTANGPGVEYEELRQMLQRLLIERFGIQAHMEERPVTAYNLEAADPKLKPADSAERTQCGEGPGPGEKDPRSTRPILNRVIHCRNISLAEFGRQLPSLAYGYIYSPVLDDTGLKGRYDFTLSFSSDNRLQPGSGEPGAAGSASGPSQGASLAFADPNGAVSFFDAIHHQLGLRLEKVRRPVPVLVIDHINRQPSAN
ncbi:MAG: TIGR03435 family protein [Acidobacteriaceae bacterium]